MTEPGLLIDARAIVKRFGGETALDHVDFTLRAGEIHALLGENGAGKSTLIKVLAGVLQRDGGTLQVAGQDLPGHFSGADVGRAGLSFVHQDLGLLDHLSISENIALAVGYRRRGRLIRFGETERHAAEILHTLNVDLDPATNVGDLAQDEKVMVAVARAFSANARAVVLDEVSSSLPAPDAARLGRALTASRDSGVGYVYVTHRLDEVFELADRITVLRDGRVVATARTAEASYDQVVEWIVGPGGLPARHTRRAARTPAPAQEATLVVDGLRGPGLPAPVSFTARAGEIVALCGLVGCGAREVAALLGGASSPSAGTVRLGGEALPLGRSDALRSAGCAYVPGDRQAEGAIAGMSIRENLFLVRGPDPAGAGFWRWTRPERRAADALADRFRVRPRGDVDRPLHALSGGNQQKVIVGRALRVTPRLLVIDDPTAGVDVGARAQIHEIVRGAADQGAVVVLASTDFEEVAGEADRALVMVHGAVQAELAGDALAPDRLASASYARSNQTHEETTAG